MVTQCPTDRNWLAKLVHGFSDPAIPMHHFYTEPNDCGGFMFQQRLTKHLGGREYSEVLIYRDMFTRWTRPTIYRFYKRKIVHGRLICESLYKQGGPRDYNRLLDTYVAVGYKPIDIDYVYLS